MTLSSLQCKSRLAVYAKGYTLPNRVITPSLIFSRTLQAYFLTHVMVPLEGNGISPNMPGFPFFTPPFLAEHAI